MVEILKEAFLGSINSVYSIAIIVIPIMIVLQLLRDYKILGRIIKPFEFLASIFKISKESILPLLVGVIFGLSYGAGVIIQTSKEGNVSKRDLLLITVFLASCHAVFEDTLIFVAVGANGWLLLGTRLLAAFILTFILSRRISLEDMQVLERLKAEEI
ncbi:nucleoside recognition domain-containing protein [Clostridium aceticum]|uniref:Nucleoside recognition domain-containing protein n=1 Tax=Clostridium aceticum TaxID=84022 RepID=A0A0D8IAA0_9CLOT|nr:nucleoside recognition domain-containing protein [Clostridium aceticum]AKL94314.1 nucleoside recognition domain-containing protein [Clostridium aceticum]KJF26156.1 nucleoside recognition protein [Clostridium aceticum]